MVTIIVAVFITGYFLIAIEGVTKISKSAIALLMGVLCWTLLMVGTDPSQTKNLTDVVFPEHVSEVCQTILFLMGAMTIVEVVDSNGGFNFITRFIRTKNSKVLLWEIVFLTFFLSAVLDNMTTCIVMIMVLKKLIENHDQRLMYAGITILAANAGGAFSPIGDVTTIMLWIKGCISTEGVLTNMFIPSIVSVVIPTFIVSFGMKGQIKESEGNDSDELPSENALNQSVQFSKGVRVAIFFIGVLGLASVPIFRAFTGLPPFVGILGVLSILWIFTEIVIRRDESTRLMDEDNKPRMSTIIRKIDMSTIMFFLGVLFAVSAVEETGALSAMGTWLNNTFSNIYCVNSIIGILSSVIDNVPLVASCMGMYDIAPSGVADTLQAYCQDGQFWSLLTYCAGVGGSILIIGSAAGVVVMGLEKIDFVWYMKKFSWLAIIGYFAGIAVYWLQNQLF